MLRRTKGRAFNLQDDKLNTSQGALALLLLPGFQHLFQQTPLYNTDTLNAEFLIKLIFAYNERRRHKNAPDRV